METKGEDPDADMGLEPDGNSKGFIVIYIKMTATLETHSTKELQTRKINNNAKLCKTRQEPHGSRDSDDGEDLTKIERNLETKYCGESD